MKWWELRDEVQRRWQALLHDTVCRARGHRWRGVIHGWRCARCNTFSAR